MQMKYIIGNIADKHILTG